MLAFFILWIQWHLYDNVLSNIFWKVHVVCCASLNKFLLRNIGFHLINNSCKLFSWLLIWLRQYDTLNKLIPALVNELKVIKGNLSLAYEKGVVHEFRSLFPYLNIWYRIKNIQGCLFSPFFYSTTYSNISSLKIPIFFLLTYLPDLIS